MGELRHIKHQSYILLCHVIILFDLALIGKIGHFATVLTLDISPQRLLSVLWNDFQEHCKRAHFTNATVYCPMGVAHLDAKYATAV